MAPSKLQDLNEAFGSRSSSTAEVLHSKLNTKLNGATRKTEKHVNVPNFDVLDIDNLPFNTVSKISVTISRSALGAVDVPVFVYRSRNPGPVIGITSAIHGNEVNGVAVIQKLFASIEQEHSSSAEGMIADGCGNLRIDCGTIVAVPVVNVPGFLASIRCFDDESKQDLNRLMPGKIDGAAPQQYAYHIFNKIVTKFDYLIDLHTASLGRRNSLYVRADMNQPIIAKMAKALKPQVLVHISTGGSLRGCAQDLGIHAITVEIGNASSFQAPFIEDTYRGIINMMHELGVSAPSTLPAYATQNIESLYVDRTVVCTSSYWIFSQTGGILKVFKDIAQIVRPGEMIAQIESIFGDPVEAIYAPDYLTVVVGIEANPVAKEGNRIVHLGVIGDSFSPAKSDGHL